MSKYSIYADSVNGSDNNPGTQLLPYATLNKVSAVLSNSTSVFLAKGSSFVNDKLTISGKNNITINSYGNGDSPILTGLKVITGWTSLGGNLWSHQDNNFPSEITNVFINGQRAIIGRTAQKTATGGSNSTLIDSTLTDPDGYWNGAELVILIQKWARSISRVSNYANKTLTFPIYYHDQEQTYYYSVSAGKTYWIQNHINCLANQNQWCYNPTTKTLYVYSTSEPTDVTATYGDDCIYADSVRYLTIKNITINGAQQTGIQVINSSYLTIDAVNFNYSGIYSIFPQYTNWIKITNCIGLVQNNDFININTCHNIFIENNQGVHCGVDAGATRYMNVPGKGGSAGLTIMFSKNITLRNNLIAYTSYNGISINYTHVFNVDTNHVHHFNLNKFDGAGVYAVLSGRHFTQKSWIYPTTKGKILRNVCLEGNVTETSSGIYPDDDSQDIEVAYNFSTKCKYGTLLHDNALMNVHDNIFLTDGGQTAGLYHHMTGANSIRSIINNNLFINNTPSAASVYINVGSVRKQTYINNRYYYPVGKVGTGGDNSINQIATGWYTLAQWLADESRVEWTRTGEVEMNPSICDTGLMSTTDFVVYFNNTTNENTEINQADLIFSDYLDLEGNAPSFPITVLPHTTLILVRAPKPEFSYAEISAAKEIKIYTTMPLSAIIPATSAFSNGSNTVSSVDVTGNIITLTMVDNVSDNAIAYIKPGSNKLTALYGTLEMDSFSESMAPFTMTLTSQGNGTGIASWRMQSKADIVMTCDGNGYFCDNAAGDNPVQTKTITAGLGTIIRDFFVKCTSGVSTITFSNIKHLTRITAYTTGNANCPILGGDMTPAVNLNRFVLTGYNTLTCDITKMRSLTQLSVGGNCAFTGDIQYHTLLDLVGGCTGITYTSIARLKGLYNLTIPVGTTVSQANVNQLLAEARANKDENKDPAYSTRNLDLRGSASSGSPSGQGIIDKAYLQGYRSPYNDATKSLWTVTTR